MPDATTPDADAFTVTRGELRRAVYEHFYPGIPPSDATGQARIDRSVDRLMESLGVTPPPPGGEDR